MPRSITKSVEIFYEPLIKLLLLKPIKYPLLGLWQRFTRYHSIAHGCIIYKSSHNGSGLFQIIQLQMIISVHVGVMRARSIIKRVLDKLETRNTYYIESLMIC